MLARSLAAPAILVAALLLVPATVNAAPSITVDLKHHTIQRLADAFMAVPQIRSAFKDGDVLGFQLTESSVIHGKKAFRGTIADGRADMKGAFSAEAATHLLELDGIAAVSLANAYDPSNSGKLLVKGGYVGLTSKSAGVQLAFNTLVKTPADARLASYDPKLGDSITHGGCTGTLEQSPTPGYFQVQLCDTDYVVNALGGVNGMIPRLVLSDVCRQGGKFAMEDGFAPARSAGWSCSYRSDDLHLSGGDQQSIRDTCRAALGPSPKEHPASALWGGKYALCVRNNFYTEA